MSAQMYAPDYLRQSEDKNLHNIADMIEAQIKTMDSLREKLDVAREALILIVDAGDKDGVWVNDYPKRREKCREALAKLEGK